VSNSPQQWKPLIRPSAAPDPADDSKERQPQAFLSYARESDPHAIWVYELASRLQGDGVRVILDQWDMPLGSEMNFFMERGIEGSDFVIVICTPTYAEKANNREGGVGWESMVITGELSKRIESRKFIPVLRRGDWESSPPVYLRKRSGVDLRDEPYSEAEYIQLVRNLHGEQLRPPPVGPKPQFAAQHRAISAVPGLIQSTGTIEPEAKSNRVQWNDGDPGPCINVTVSNSREVIEAGQAIGLEYPAPLKLNALLDTGAAVSVISKTFAKYCKLLQTGETEIRALGSLHRCGEHAAAISFPDMNLRSIDPIRVISADFIREPNYACLIGRDILRNWKIIFDGRSKCVTITD
jgi:hypothetical protein